MNALVLLDDIWHPAEVLRNGLTRLERFGYEFDWLDNAALWSADRMAACPLVILAKADHVSSADETSWMSAGVQQCFVQYVQSGNGLLVLHSGAAGCSDADLLRGLTGARFLGHPAQCAVTVNPVPSHRLAAGCETFTVIDEHYAMRLVDEDADVFVSTTSMHGTQPAGWTLDRGHGRVCVLTPGHNPAVWAHPLYRRLLLNALRWCGKAND